MCLLAGASFFVHAAAADPDGATITYRRVFKGSTPEFIEVKISEQGKATFDIRQLDEDADPEAFEVGADVRKKIFELAAELKISPSPSLDIQKKIANLGQKTFRYENGAEVHETTFNYTLNPSATSSCRFSRAWPASSRTWSYCSASAKFDRLGVNDALMQFETDMEHRLLPEPERLLPVLDQIAADSHFVEIARSRARALAERIRNSREHP